MSSGGNGVLIDDSSSAQQRLVGLHQDHSLPGVLSESGVELSSATWHSVVVTNSARTGSRSHEIGHTHVVRVGVGLLLELLTHLLGLLRLANLDTLLLVGLDALLLELLARGLVAAVVEEGADDLAVVLSKDGRWPGIGVVGVTAALADQVATHITAVGEGHAELLLLRGQDDGGLGDDSDSVAELNLSAVQGSGAGLGHNGEGLILVSADDVGRVVGRVGLTGWDVVGTLEGGGVGTLGSLGRNVAGSLRGNVARGGHRGNVTGGRGTSGLGRNVTRGGVGWLRRRRLVTAAHVIVEASGSLRG